ncbi:MAG: hypothetical protein AUK47_19280 [Deltaproteobacteria bacterium CG2_30_63_29]|nr:MAG: hypothetical protein AUK47_19280 [Deltaproteobacteria bacterium CG2_30_63_29]
MPASNSRTKSGEIHAFRLGPEAKRKLLDERAELLARPANFSDQLTDRDVYHFVAARVGETQYCVDLKHLKEIRIVEKIAVIPCTPKFLLGLVQVHGEISAVVDLVEFFGFRRTEALPQPTTLLIIESRGYTLALAVDQLFDVQPIGQSEVGTVPATVSRTEREVMRGITSSKSLLLDVDALVTHPRLAVGG